MTIKRPMCPECNKHFCAVNYKKNGVTHYRRLCDRCGSAAKKVKNKRYNWEKAGYTKKGTCDLCGFKATYSSQIVVFHIDGNLNDVAFSNLRSICLNCVEIVKNKNVTWKRGDLKVDYLR